VIARHQRFTAAAVRDQEAGAVLFGVGMGFALAALVAGSISFDQADFTWTPGVLPPLVGISATFTALGIGVREKARHAEHQLAEDYRLETILDRDEAWRAIERHNARLRRELGLPDDERMDAPRPD
jgi:hypothetical protein